MRPALFKKASSDTVSGSPPRYFRSKNCAESSFPSAVTPASCDAFIVMPNDLAHRTRVSAFRCSALLGGAPRTMFQFTWAFPPRIFGASCQPKPARATFRATNSCVYEDKGEKPQQHAVATKSAASKDEKRRTNTQALKENPLPVLPRLSNDCVLSHWCGAAQRSA
jgi:hypothetical protein